MEYLIFSVGMIVISIPLAIVSALELQRESKYDARHVRGNT